MMRTHLPTAYPLFLSCVVWVQGEREGGDSVTCALLARFAADGFSEGQTAVGNAEAMTLYSQAAVINEIGTTCAPTSQNSIDHQRIPFNLRDEAKGLLGLWFGERWATRLSSLLVM